MNIKVAVLCVTMACASLFAAETKTVDQRLPLKAEGLVTLESHNGSIQVRTWDRAEIEIHARIESANSSPEDIRRFNETTVEIESSPNAVRIKSKLPEDCCFFWAGHNPEIHYTITAPRTAQWTIRDHNSKTDIRDISSAVDLNTHNGEVRVANLSGPLELTMHNGSANVEFASFRASSRVETHNSSVELTLPRDSRFDLRSSTHHGRVRSDFPIAMRGLGRWNGAVEGSVNGGGPVLRLSSHNGDFRLRAK